MAYAPTAVPRSGHGPVRAALDPAARSQGLLGHGSGSGGISPRTRAMQSLGERDWRDLQLLSQLAWMDEEYLASDPLVSRLARKGTDYTEQDKQDLRAKQIELLGRVLPEYRRAASAGQIEISATPFYHPILPLLCDSDIARMSNPGTPLPFPAF